MSLHPLLDRSAERPVDPQDVATLTERTVRAAHLERITVDYPATDSVFPPDFVAPTFLWHDDAPQADTWFVRIEFPGDDHWDLSLLVPGTPPTEGEIDPNTVTERHDYRPTPYQASAHSWQLSETVWAALREHDGEGPFMVRIVGFASFDPETPLSRGSVALSISEDPVGAPIFYRDVPLMPAVGESNVIKPLSRGALPLIQWRLKDVSRPDSRVVLAGMPTCGNCHSFSRDGRTLGMDIDGPQGDKGMYAVAPIAPKTTVGRKEVISWNSFSGKIDGHKTIGFLSRMSPDGRFVVSTVNESVYVVNFADYRFLQVFFPTRGILAFYSVETGKIKALPGADDPAFVHCAPVWSPDGETIVFARAIAQDAFSADRPAAMRPNDPNETQIRYDLYRMPFNGGRGGVPTPIDGASMNGMSNTFPKVSPDGRWVVYTKCMNGQLMRPDGRLWIVPLQGGTAREMTCNTSLMNSWHSFSPNGRWMVFASKANRPFTQMFLTHIDEDGNDTPPILVPRATAANRAVNLPEFLNAPFDALEEISVPVVDHYAYVERARKLLEERKLEAARSALEKAVAVESSTLTHGMLALVHQQLGQMERAREHYEKALAIDGRDLTALGNLGVVLMGAGETDRAMDLWRKSIEIDPSAAFANSCIGLRMWRLGRLDEAKQHFEQILVGHPGYLAAHVHLGMMAAHVGRHAEAVKHYEEALRIAPSDVHLHEKLLELYMGMRNIPGVIRQLQVLADERPDDASVRLRLAWRLATSRDDSLRDGPRAVALASRAVEIAGGRDAAALDVLAAAFAEVGEFAKAVKTADSAARLAEPRNRRLAADIRERRRSYESERPHRAGP